MLRSLFLIFVVSFAFLSKTFAAPLQSPSTAILNVENENQRRQLSKKKNTTIPQEEVPEIVPGEAEDTGELVIFKRRPLHNFFEVSVDSQLYYTSNMLLEEGNRGRKPIDTEVLVSTAQFAIAPDAYDLFGGQFSPRVGFRYQWYNYSLHSNRPMKAGFGLNNFDFDAETVFAEGRYRFGDNWIITAGFDWLRLLSHEPPTNNYAEFYKEYVPRIQVEKIFQLTDAQFLSIAYQGNFHFTQTDPPDTTANDRTDHNITVSYTAEILPQLYFQPFGRVQFTHFTSQDDPADGNLRNDLLYSTGLTLQYAFNNWSSIRTFFNYDHRESDSTIIADYDKWDSGVGVSLVFRF